jgi:hypothetical protein
VLCGASSVPQYVWLCADSGDSLRSPADRDVLDAFRRDWRWHHPFEETQLPFAGQTTQIKKVSFYHGGEELYELAGVPGIWHGQCLRAVNA